MFIKYNAVLRGTLRYDVPRLAQLQKRLNLGNLYPSSISAINRAIAKLAPLSAATPLYRGIIDTLLPTSCFEPSESGMRGGTEPGFLSCGTLKEALLHLGGRHVAILFKLSQGFDRAADFSKLGQLPHRSLFVLPPLTGLEVQGMRVAEHTEFAAYGHGEADPLLVVEARVRCFLASPSFATTASPTLRQLCEQGSRDAAFALVRTSYPLAMLDEAGYTCRMLAAQRGHEQVYLHALS